MESILLIILFKLVGFSLPGIILFMLFMLLDRRRTANSSNHYSHLISMEEKMETILKQNEEIIALLKERNHK
ncbi:hypothetical protein NCCP2222_31910 [Sporosarcina sp. NCCP-2222]|uniref:hypothetical protein n=1 Tax=Sporosarcina sp. NCCP-2222 TaxID=2935073 RepID=UPI00207F0E17|nr:hypothetical protein [Sporosarcina sp. NCCP-2222]GKV57244.1 hypothetical protein NCCP2222_31910 [Sporosarcina sp. NCCP-2222]